jgi:hypothetical protein
MARYIHNVDSDTGLPIPGTSKQLYPDDPPLMSNLPKGLPSSEPIHPGGFQLNNIPTFPRTIDPKFDKGDFVTHGDTELTPGVIPEQGDLANVDVSDKQLPRPAPRGEYVPLKFPEDLGDPHHADYIGFYFLDIVKDGAWYNTDSHDKGYREDAKTKSNSTGITNMTANGSNTVGKVVNLLDKPLVTDIAKSVVGVGLDIGDAFTEGKQGDSGERAGKIVAKGITATKQALSLNTIYANTGDVIKLMMPSSIQFNSGAGWQAVDAQPTNIGLLAEIPLGEVKLSELVGRGVANIIANTLYSQGAEVLSSTSKRNFNPYVSQSFESMNRRQFRFEWLLTPHNSGEMSTIQSIIRMFRFHMHPSLKDNEPWLVFPSQVDIKWGTVNNKPNDNLPKIATCVIKDFSTNYTPNNQWSTVDDPFNLGAPYQYHISVTLEEVVPLTKQDVRKGY